MKSVLLVVTVIMAAIVVLLGVILWRRSREPSQPRNGSQESGAKWDQLRSFTRGGSAILSIIVAVGFLWWIYHTDVSLAELSEWAQEHWPFVAVLTAILVGVIANFAKASARKTLLWVLAGAVLTLFLGASVISWFAEGGKGTISSQTSCPTFSPDETRSCVADTHWSSWIGTSVPTYRNQYQYCLSTGPYRMQYKLSADSPPMDWHPGESTNPMYLRFKTTDGTYTIKYRLAESCPNRL